ncbi:MAG: biotin--[acetyl-CoA-carboxylase] ligase [Clostridiales bacterium]|nr:biotin--[acetyl-CoA-carboxylase] ligase [Clostridiales bacterium]
MYDLKLDFSLLIYYNIAMLLLNEKFIRMHTGLNVNIVESCTSTFDEIGKYDAIIAGRQINGVGRGNHTFFCPDGGLYIVMRVQGVYIDPHTLTPAVGLAMHDTIQAILGLPTRIKWVNDILYKGKKAAGILCKCVRKAEYLVGIGVNYATDPVELENAGLSDIAISLEAPPSRASAFVTGLLRMIKRATIATFDPIKYGKLCVNIGKIVEFNHNGVIVRGFAERIDADGSLIVRIGNATIAVDAGEVSILRNVPTP